MFQTLEREDSKTSECLAFWRHLKVPYYSVQKSSLTLQKNEKKIKCMLAADGEFNHVGELRGVESGMILHLL